LIDVITEAANGFLRKLIADGAILDGKAWYDSKLNPVEELNSGHVTLSYDFMPPPPAESITYKATVNINYLREIGST
jgi:phage tail sheath protein FI